MKRSFFFFVAVIFSILTSFSQFSDTLNINYFGQTCPGKKAELFAPEFISRNDWNVQNGCFSQNGKEFVFVKIEPGFGFQVMYTQFKEGEWTEPIKLFPEERYLAMPFFSYDGNTLFFSSSLVSFTQDGDIYMSRRRGEVWQKPERIGHPVSSDVGKEWEVSESRNGTLYYCSSRPGGKGMYDVYRSKLVEGKYPDAENLNKPINSVSLDECPYISPDESFLVFNSWKYNPKFKGNNLYVSYYEDDKWSQPIDLGSSINTDELDIYPNITPDGKYLLFTRVKYTTNYKEYYSKIYWISTEVLDSVKNSKCEIFKPLSVSQDELNYYSGVYSNLENSLKITITNKGDYLNALFNDLNECLEAIGIDTFWGHGFTLKFNRESNELILKHDVKGGLNILKIKEVNGSDFIVLNKEKE